jgi:hypothetical protein
VKYELTRWAGGYVTLGRFPTFPEALSAFAACGDTTKQLVNVDRADSGRDGLTDEERDQLAEVTYAEERIVAELERCDRLGVAPGAEHMRLVSERRRMAAEHREGNAA